MVELSLELGKHWSQIRLSRRNKNSHIGHIEFEATVRHQSISVKWATAEVRLEAPRRGPGWTSVRESLRGLAGPRLGVAATGGTTGEGPEAGRQHAPRSVMLVGD